MRVLSLLSTVVLTATASIGLQAGTLTFASVGTAVDPNQFQTFGNSLTITPAGGWATPLPGSSWVSYGTTGDPAAPGYFMPPNGTVVSFFQLLTIPELPYTATVTFRADDSAALYVNGTLVVPEATTINNTYLACSDFPVGCTTQNEVTANITAYLSPAIDNVLRFDVAQRASVSFGLNYSGSAGWHDTPVVENPEPATMVMLGTGCLLIGLLGRKRR